jgi:predicted nucleotidyltransferase
MNPDYSQKLKEFEEYLKKIPKIIAVLYTGSTASKKWDKYSDIDIDVVVEDKDYENVVKMLPKLLSWWGKIKLINHYKGSDEKYAFVGEDYFKVEIDPIKKSEIKPSWKVKNIRIAYDKEGTLTKAFKKSQKEKRPKFNIQEFTHLLLETRSNLIYIAAHSARGQKFSGCGEITTVRWDLFYLLSRLKGLEGYELMRGAEKLLCEKEWKLWKDSDCKSYDKQELKRASNANWEFMKYIEKKCEKKTGKKLNLKCDDKEILKRIGKIIL